MSGGGSSKKPKQTWGEKEIAKIAAEKWNHYQEYGVDVENTFIDKAQMREKDYEQAAGFANVDTQKAFGDAPVVQSGGQRHGNLAVDIADRGIAKGESVGANLATSGIQTDDRHMQGKMAIVAAGLGKSTQAQRGLTDVAQSNLNNAINDANNAYRNRSATRDGVMTVAGGAARGMTGGSEPYKPTSSDFAKGEAKYGNFNAGYSSPDWMNT